MIEEMYARARMQEIDEELGRWLLARDAVAGLAPGAIKRSWSTGSWQARFRGRRGAQPGTPTARPSR